MSKTSPPNGPAIVKSSASRIWQALSRPSTRYSLGALLVMGGVLGGGLIWSAGWALKATEQTDFCLSCHEMKAYVLPGHQSSPHFTNRTGVRAECADCHVPKDLSGRLAHKARLMNEVWLNWQGVIATPERYAARRQALAQRVWARLEADGSQTCKTCHSHAAMAAHEQSPEAAAMMSWAVKAGTHTCISCHKGVSHTLPESWVQDAQ